MHTRTNTLTNFLSLSLSLSVDKLEDDEARDGDAVLGAVMEVSSEGEHDLQMIDPTNRKGLASGGAGRGGKSSVGRGGKSGGRGGGKSGGRGGGRGGAQNNGASGGRGGASSNGASGGGGASGGDGGGSAKSNEGDVGGGSEGGGEDGEKGGGGGGGEGGGKSTGTQDKRPRNEEDNAAEDGANVSTGQPRSTSGQFTKRSKITSHAEHTQGRDGDGVAIGHESMRADQEFQSQSQHSHHGTHFAIFEHVHDTPVHNLPISTLMFAIV